LEVKVKDENKESIHKEAIEKIKDEIVKLILKIKLLYDKSQYKHEQGSTKS